MKIICYILMFFLLIISVNATYITLEKNFEILDLEDEIKLNVLVTNKGESPAINVVQEINFMNYTFNGEIFNLKPKESFNQLFNFSDLIKKDFFLNKNQPIIIKTLYMDNNMYSFSNFDLIIPSNEQLNVSKEISYKKGIVKGNFEYDGFFKMNVLCPDEFYCSEPVLNGNNFEFSIDNLRGVEGSLYNVHVIFEAEDLYSFESISVSVSSDKEKEIFWFILLIILSLFLLFFYFYKKFFYKLNLFLIIEFLILFIILLFIWSYFGSDLIFSDTITTGGDTASHYLTAEKFSDFIPYFSGWFQGNYAGFPLLNFYFPLPFFIMWLFSYLIPLTISFKIVTLLGTFLLPISGYVLFKMLRVKRGYALFGAIATLPFLFLEANSMWGGNIPSTLAGEFSYSLGLSLTLLFLGTLYRGINEGKYLILNIILLSLIGLSHVYTLLFAGFSSLFFIFYGNFYKRIKYLIYLAIGSFSLISFWLLPLIFKINYTTSYVDKWKFTLSEAFPIILLPFICCLLLFFLYLFNKKINLNNKKESVLIIFYFLFMILIAYLLYLFSNKIGVVDIRLIPFIQLVSQLLGSYALCLFFINFINFDNFIKFKKLFDYFFIFLILILFIFFISSSISFIPSWVKWNYEGFENKGSWDDFKSINDGLSGDFSDPRVIFEHSNLHNRFGSTRAFESLPLFSGRATLEGLYMQSSLNAPFIFYLQALISNYRSCPFPNFGCSKQNIERAISRLKMYNVNQVISVDPITKNLLKEDINFKKDFSVKDYEIFSLLENTSYVFVPKYEPIYLDSPYNHLISYLWYLNDSLIDVFLVFDENSNNFINSLEGVEKNLINKTCLIEEKIDEDKIFFKTNCVGVPHIIKFSYFPNWKVIGANKIYHVSPSFMMVIPNQEEIYLSYENTSYDIFGFILSIVMVFILFFSRYLRRFDFFFEQYLKRYFIYLFVILILSFVFLFLNFNEGYKSDSIRMDIAVSTGSYVVCEHVKESDICYIEVSKKTNDKNLCYARVKKLKDECFKNFE